MFTRCTSFSAGRLTFTILLRHLSQYKKLYKMYPRKLIVTHQEKEESVGISFRYVNEDHKIDRIFNLNRGTNEQLGSVLKRINSSISKVAMKKRKKSKQEELPEIPIKLVQLDCKGTESSEQNDSSQSQTLFQTVNEETTCINSLVHNGHQHSLIIGKDQYILDINPPIVQSLNLPKNIMAGFQLYPTKFDMIFGKEDDSLFTWYRSEKKYESEKDGKSNLLNIQWEKVGDAFLYNTSSEDIGKLLKLEVLPRFGERCGESAEVVADVLVSAGPGECPFERRHAFTKKMAGNKSLRVISYNILADLYADSDFSRTSLFPTIPPYALAQDYRRQLLLKEIIGYNGDLVCLQEVDEKIFIRDLKPGLGKLGLEGTYSSKGGQVTEGTSIFYRSNKLRMVDEHRIVLSRELQDNPLLADLWEAVQSNDSFKERLIQRTTTLQISVLESVGVQPNRRIVVANTHLYFHPDADHIRMLQAGICLRILRQIMMLHEAKDPSKDVSLLFCGDFNSTPEFGVYRLMTSQFIDTDDMDWNSNEAEKMSNISLNHDLEIGSAAGCPDYTNYTTGFYGCLDYIFYQSDKFDIANVIPVPSHEEVTEHTALPSITFPSDHIALIADLTYKHYQKDS